MTEQEQALRINEIIEAYPPDQRNALAIMQDMQHAFNYIPEQGLRELSAYLGCSQAQLYSMATFYKALSLTPKGEHIIKICNGTACHLRGSMNLATELKRHLGIDPGQTTEDGKFSVELVNCLGSCALAPVMVVDATYHNKLSVEQIANILESYASANAPVATDEEHKGDNAAGNGTPGDGKAHCDKSASKPTDSIEQAKGATS